MKQAKIGNPLRRRVFRDCLRDWKRYSMIFLMLVVTIGFVSGMYVANNSMEISLNKATDKLKRESGHFELAEKADPELIRAIETGERADVVSVFREKAYKEAEPEVEKAVREAVEENVREQVEATIKEQVTAAVEEQLAAAEAMGMTVSAEQREETLREALDTAMKENFESAVSDALKEAYDSDEYRDALSDAMLDAKKEIDEEIDKEYDKLADRYELKETADPVPVKVYELFRKEASEILPADSSYTGKVRVFSERKEVNLYDILEGRAPQTDREIIIDRMHAENAGIKVGDTLKAGDCEFTVVGYAAFVDYTTLYENNTDTMFDAMTFDVAMVTDEGFERIHLPVRYSYAFCYETTPPDTQAEKTASDNFMKALITQVAAADEENEIKDYVPAYANNAITFAPNDFGKDKTIGGVLLYVLTAVLAFIFAVTISSTLDKESTVIGTLRASGYTKGELLRYYMSAPLLIVVLASIVGNVLGYTFFKNVVVGMYRNSYSLPAYETYWNADAFVRTTVVPFVLMLLINVVVITRTLRLSPLRFLRHDLKTTKRKKAMRLPKWNFFSRFRLRVFFQNIPNYVMLFIGILLVMLLLSMAVGMPSTLAFYQDTIGEMVFAEDQLILLSTEDEDGNPITTKTEGAERFSATSLERKSSVYNEEVMVYGIEKNSRYISFSSEFENSSDGSSDITSDDSSDVVSVYISKAYAEKYNVRKGDTITLSEKYENVDYVWKVYDIYDYSAGIVVFMPNDRFNEVFDLDPDSFTGYLSDRMIEDIDSKYIAKEITADDLIKLTRQLDHSMGAYMVYFQYVNVIVAAIILYLLTKIIIEKNERSISMVKILGYDNGEIASLYMLSTAVVVFFSEFVAIYLGYLLMTVLWKLMMMSMGGWFAFVMTPSGFVKEFILVFVAYLIISVCDFLRIRRIPKALALKNVE